jgi:tetratricopeptide (TPR) repeat protein
MREEDYIWIERWLDGDLSAEEKAAFEARMESDPEFRQAVALRQDMASVVDGQLKREAFQAQLESVGSKYFDTPSPRRPYAWIILLLAVVTALVLWWSGLFSPQSPQNLFQEYHQPPPIAWVSQGTQETLRSQAQTAFNQGDYSLALSHIDRLLTQNPTNPEYQWYRGICLLETGDLESALAIFSALAEGNTLLRPDAQWYLALTYLKMEHLEQCQEVLQEIPEESSYFEKARALNKRL